MTTFTIEPYVGAIPIRFGMTPDQVEVQLGAPLQILRGPFGNRCEVREHLSVGYAASDNTLMEAVFSPGARLMFRGCDLFDHPDPVSLLQQFDPSPYLWVGFLIFLRLGTRLSGFHDRDESQKAISAVRRGYWDDYVDEFVPYLGAVGPENPRGVARH